MGVADGENGADGDEVGEGLTSSDDVITPAGGEVDGGASVEVTSTEMALGDGVAGDSCELVTRSMVGSSISKLVDVGSKNTVVVG